MSQPRVVLATRNPKKLEELRRLLAAAEPAASVTIVGLDDVPAYDEVPESEVTFAGNALLKAREAARRTGLIAVADDSGLCVDVLGGAPGIFSARWAGRHGDDAANLDLLLAQIADVPDEHRGAAFVCAAAVATPDGVERVVEGTVRGVLARLSRGSGGFGYDPVFVPSGLDVTAAELAPEAKDEISHRGQAMRALVPILVRLLEGGTTE